MKSTFLKNLVIAGVFLLTGMVSQAVAGIVPSPTVTGPMAVNMEAFH